MLVALQPTALSPTSESVQFSLEGQWYMLTMPKIFMPAVSSAQQDTTFGAKFALINFEPALFQLVEWL
jgi:hypothetical protein